VAEGAGGLTGVEVPVSGVAKGEGNGVSEVMTTAAVRVGVSIIGEVGCGEDWQAASNKPSKMIKVAVR
jgi:hypothetical protein